MTYNDHSYKKIKGDRLYRVSISLRKSSLDNYIKHYETVTDKRELARQARKVISAARPRILARLQRYPGRTRYRKLNVVRGWEDQRIIWASERQRIAVMAYLRGMPYRRTNKLARGWEIELVPIKKSGTVASLAIANKAIGDSATGGYVYYAKYVYGTAQRPEYQQIMHAQTGWDTAKDLRKAAQDILAEEFDKNMELGD